MAMSRDEQKKLEDILIQATQLRSEIRSATAAMAKAEVLLEHAEKLVRSTISGRLTLVIGRGRNSRK